MNKLTNLDEFDKLYVLHRLPAKLKDIIEESKFPVYIAGGCIRSVIAKEDIKDIDLFVASKELAKTLKDNIVESFDCPFVETDNAYTVCPHKGRPIQVIHKWTFAMTDRIQPPAI